MGENWRRFLPIFSAPRGRKLRTIFTYKFWTCRRCLLGRPACLWRLRAARRGRRLSRPRHCHQRVATGFKFKFQPREGENWENFSPTLSAPRGRKLWTRGGVTVAGVGWVLAVSGGLRLSRAGVVARWAVSTCKSHGKILCKIQLQQYSQYY